MRVWLNSRGRCATPTDKDRHRIVCFFFLYFLLWGMRRQRLSVSRLCTVLAQPKANWSCESSHLQTPQDLRCCLKTKNLPVVARPFRYNEVLQKVRWLELKALQRRKNRMITYPPRAPEQGRWWKMLLLSLNAFSWSTPPPPCQRRSSGVHLCCHGFPDLFRWTNCATRSDLIV